MARIPEKDRRRVGTFLHDCGQVATVFQNKRRHLYLNCPACGHQNNNTAAEQTRIYRGMTRGDVPFEPPRNLLADQNNRALPESSGDALPKTAPKTEIPTENTPKTDTENFGSGQSGGGLGLLLIFLGLAGAAAAVLR